MAALSQLWAAPLLAPVLAPSPRRAAATATCPGDCDADGAVGIAELRRRRLAARRAAAERVPGLLERSVSLPGAVRHGRGRLAAAAADVGRHRGRGRAAGRGTFAIGDFPEVAETGVWQAERLDRPGRRR